MDCEAVSINDGVNGNRDGGLFVAIAGLFGGKREAVTVGNTIFDFGMTSGTLSHELVHVFEFQGDWLGTAVSGFLSNLPGVNRREVPHGNWWNLNMEQRAATVAYCRQVGASCTTWTPF